MSSTAMLTGPDDSFPQIKDLGISSATLPFTCLIALDPQLFNARKSIPDTEAEKASKRGKRKNEVQPNKI